MSLRFKLIITMTVLALLGAGGFFGWRLLNNRLLAPMRQTEELLAEYQAIYGEPESMVYVYTVVGDQSAGSVINEEELQAVAIPALYVGNLITDPAALVGNYFRVEAQDGGYITTDMVMVNPVEDGERAYDVLTDFNPIGLMPGDYVDIRINLPMGEDYIAISHKRVEGVYNGVLKLSMNQYDIAVYNSLLVDTSLFPGSLIYTTKYLEPSAQSPSIATYPVNASVLAAALDDPNISQSINYAKNLSRRTVLETAMEELGVNEAVRAMLQTSKNNIPARIQAGESDYLTQLQLEEQRLREEALYGKAE